MKLKVLTVIALITSLISSSLASDRTKVVAVVANVMTNVFTSGKQTVTEIGFINSTNLNGVVKLLDTGTLTTNRNYVQLAYTNYTTVPYTNITTFTNATGIIITNTFPGWSHQATAVPASTNALPAAFQFIAPASAARFINALAVQPLQGLCVFSTVDGQIEIGYTQEEP